MYAYGCIIEFDSLVYIGACASYALCISVDITLTVSYSDPMDIVPAAVQDDSPVGAAGRMY